MITKIQFVVFIGVIVRSKQDSNQSDNGICLISKLLIVFGKSLFGFGHSFRLFFVIAQKHTSINYDLLRVNWLLLTLKCHINMVLSVL